ncbi:hypothetical protein BH10ACT5_BH10ACT5_19990 [soil metagenome]
MATDSRVPEHSRYQYFGVDVDTVRDVIETHLPALEAALRAPHVAE